MTGADVPSVKRWPLVLIASPAAVAIWSGWVGLGQLCGFGPIHPLPGIADSLTINTAITLPIGVEAYGAYALRAWLTSGTPGRAQRFAKASALGALALGMCGQVIYHLLAAAHAARAPWPVTMLVSCIPVATLGFGAALAHLLREPVAAPEATAEATAETAPADAPEPATAVPETVTDDPGDDDAPHDAGLRAELARVRAARLAAQRDRLGGGNPDPGPGAAAASEVTGPQAAPEPEVTRTRPRTRPPVPAAKQSGPVTPERIREHYAEDLAAGQVPSIRQIRREWPVGYDRARELYAALAAGEA
jgi:hypothetical protein